MNLKKLSILIVLIYLLTFIFSFFFNFSYADELDYSEELDLESLEVVSPVNSIPDLNSRAAIVIERTTGAILFGKNENDVRKMASTTKIMTSIVVLENVKDLSQIVTVSSKSAGIGGSRLGLTTNAKITVRDLLYGLLLCSGNDAAIALAEFVGGSVEGFATLMNQKASDLGLTNTHFVTPHGLDNEEHHTTAYELALLTNYALNNKQFSKIVGTANHSVYINGSPKSIKNTNELLGYLNGVYGVKTGFTNGANRCLVTACKRGDLDIICVVLGADTKKFRTQDSIKLIEYAFANFKMINVKSMIEEQFSSWQTQTENQFYINKGVSNTVNTYVDEFPYVKYPINNQNIKDINIDINCNYYYEAPLLKDTKIGVLKCYIKDSEICDLNIYCENSVLKKDAFSYFNYFFEKYCFYLESIFDL